MTKYFSIVLMVSLLLSCNPTSTKPKTKVNPIHWEERTVAISETDSMYYGKTYLSVYSEIYSYSEETTYELTATVSMKNIYAKDTVYIARADYFNTEGKCIRTYFEKPILIKPLETVEIVINQKDIQGGSGGNFIFDWIVKKPKLEPHFEAVMISTYGQQGLSFTSQGIRILD